MLLLIAAAKGQDEKPSFGSTLSFTGSFQYGFYSAHNVKLQSILDSRPLMAEFDISSQTTGIKLWQQLNGYPVVGITLMYGNSGSSQYLGHIAAIFPFINARLYKIKDFSLLGRFGIGIGWVEKPFNPVTNYQNLVISTHLNACIRIGLYADYRVVQHLSLGLGFSLTHLSNGSTKVPNLGLNIPALSLGIKYTIDPSMPKIHQDVPAHIPKIHYTLFLSGAVKEGHPIESSSYLAWLVNFEVTKQYAYTGKFGGGINLTYDPSLKEEIPNSNVYAFDNSKLKLEASIYGSYEYVIGNLSIPLQVGIYLYNNYPESWIYQDIGVRYALSSHLLLGLGLKTHFFKADFIHWGLGYQF
jgi:hypothetical protein